MGSTKETTKTPISTTDVQLSQTTSSAYYTTEPPKPPNIENLNLMLDPSKTEERKKKVIDAKEKYNQEFGQVDFEHDGQ